MICALSGGADSVALLWSLYLLRDKQNLVVSAAHFNHGLRGAESDRDEAFVKDLCSRFEIPLEVGRGKVTASGRGLEDAARQARYAFLGSLNPEAKIATAHTADDNAETILLHLIRGTGLKGLGGIAPSRGRIIRPMLSLTRQDVEAFLQEWGLSHVTDSSNETDDFLRNRVRHQVMPVLKGENRRFSPNCSRMAESLRQDQLYLSQKAQEAFEEIQSEKGLDCEKLLRLPLALGNRVISLFLRQQGLREPEQIHIAQCRALAQTTKPSARLNLLGGVSLERRYGFLTAYVTPVPVPETVLPVGETVCIPGWEISSRMIEKVEDIQNSQFTFVLSCGMISHHTLLIRARHTGDAICLPCGHRTLKKAMIDGKIPASLRSTLPVIASGDRVLAAAGLGVNLDCQSKPGEPAVLVEVRPC